ncbi:MAG: glycine C-acetyltransferase [Candidatus Diapherotrites archaeon]|nr:glycine C-acetyltransferase [Candidatus Diapherotrites archaeon]
MKLNKPINFFKEKVDELKSKDLNWKLRILSSGSKPNCKVDGKEVIMLCSNNYLGLSEHPKVKEAAMNAIKTHGAGSGSVRAIAGNMDLHKELEETIAEFKGTESALYYQTGFAANAGFLPAFLEQGDLVISDELNHGSIIDGVRLSKAERGIYKHNDMDSLKQILEETEKKKYNKILIVSDGVFSMDGDIAPADKIVALAEQFGVFTYFDDAHGDGVLGKNGRGIANHFNVHGKVDIEMGTFSKAFGVVGGSLAGSKDMTEFAFNKSRTWLLSGSAPPATTAACTAALRVCMEEDELFTKLWNNTNYFKKKLKELGFDTGRSETPITPVMIGESSDAKKFSERLYQEGVFALPIVFPMVAQGKARIRTMITAAHKKEDLDKAIQAFEKIGKELKIIK